MYPPVQVPTLLEHRLTSIKIDVRGSTACTLTVKWVIHQKRKKTVKWVPDLRGGYVITKQIKHETMITSAS